MTALEKFARLESTGLWRADQTAQRVEVIVTFGDASLVLSDINGQPYSHWSLAAIDKISKSREGTVFTVDPKGSETLEIDDPTMLRAIDKVRAAIKKSRPRPGRLRVALGVSILAILALVMVFWLPNAAARYATSLVPDARLDQIGRDAVAHAVEFTGPICTAPEVSILLDKLEKRLIGTDSNHLNLADLGARRSALLPGGQILLNKALLTEGTGPEVLAGYVLLERAEQDEDQPLLALFRQAGMREIFRFLTTGYLGAGAVAQFTEARLTGKLSDPDPENLLTLFEVAELTRQPFASVEPDYAALANNDPFADQYLSVFSDGEWVALQSACGG